MQYARRAALAVAIIGAISLPVHASAQTVEITPGGSQVAGKFVERFAEYLAVEGIKQAMWDLQQQVGAYVASVVAEQEAEAERAAEAARVAYARSTPVTTAATPVSTGGGGSTGACGGATNGADQFIHRESGGNPGVFNTQGSGAYGCYQIMPATWASSCSDLGAEVGSSPAAQAACASRLPLSAWGG